MTTEQPTRPARPPRPGRPDPAFRRAALGLPRLDDASESATEASVPASSVPAPSTAPRRESLREALARIPDLERDDAGGAERLRVGEAPAPASTVGVSPSPGSALALGSAVARTVGPPSSRGGGAGAPGEGSGDFADVEVSQERPIAQTDVEVPAGKDFRSRASRLLNGQVPAGAEVVLAEDLEALRSGSGQTLVTDAPGPTGADDADLFVPADQKAARDGLSPDAPEWLVAAAAIEAKRKASLMSGVRARPPMWRRVGFGTLVVLLLGAIPVLGRIGYTLVTESTDGQFSSNVKSPTDPGYETEVVSTPTQVVLHNDADGRPVAATVLSLSGSEGGGAVIFVPLEAEVRSPAFGVDRISRAYDVLAVRPPDGRKQVAVQVASLLNVGIDGVVEVDDRGWAQLVDPVAPLSINNPDPIEVQGELIPSGPMDLTADQVGPYLAATRDGESAFNALVRHELVWDAWLKAIAESGRDDVVPGESGSGIGLFARSLADGPVAFSIVPTNPDADDPSLLRVDDAALGAMVLAAVPSPDPALPGSRATVRLLNGVSADGIPEGIIQSVVQIGGSVTVIGNGPTFGRDETTIVYSNPDKAGHAELLRVALGGGTVRHDREALESVDLTVILGSDVIEAASVTTTTADIGTSSGFGTGIDDTQSGSGFSTDTDTDTDPDTEPEVPE